MIFLRSSWLNESLRVPAPFTLGTTSSTDKASDPVPNYLGEAKFQVYSLLCKSCSQFWLNNQPWSDKEEKNNFWDKQNEHYEKNYRKLLRDHQSSNTIIGISAVIRINIWTKQRKEKWRRRIKFKIISRTTNNDEPLKWKCVGK